MDGKESKLSIITSADGKGASVSIMGNKESLLFNLTVLTRCVCKAVNIPPDVMACVLPVFIRDYEKSGIVREEERETE